MAFTVPNFNLTCDIYTGPWVGKVLRLPGVLCNLALGKRTQQNFQTGNSPFGYPGGPSLLVPALTDIRDASCASGYDVIEVVPGSGRWYFAAMVDDVAKGFPNEYRFVYLGKAVAEWDPTQFFGSVWPTPIP